MARNNKQSQLVSQLNVSESFKFGGTDLSSALAEAATLDGLTATATELNYTDVTTPGTAQASKAVVLDSNKDVAGLGHVAGTDWTGAVIGDVTGNLTGNTSGTHTGAVLGAPWVRTLAPANAAIAFTTEWNKVMLTKAGVNAMTLAAPTATTHDGWIVEIIATTANAHTVTCPAGKLGGSAVGTFGGAIGDRLILEAVQGVWCVNLNVNVTLT